MQQLNLNKGKYSVSCGPSSINFSHEGIEEDMKETVEMKRRQLISDFEDKLASISLLTAGIETDQVVDNAGRVTSYKCCVPFATLAAIEHKSGRSLSDYFIANKLNILVTIL